MNSPFPPELRTAAIIPRWSVVFTLTRDYVSNHSFFVALYSYQIAELIGWKGDKSELMFSALVHDLDEVYTGDLVSPTKRAIVDPLKARAFVRQKMKETMPSILSSIDDMCQGPKFGEIELIVKAADRLDAVLFLIVEERMGNKHVFDRCQDAIDQLEAAWFSLPVPMHVPVDWAQRQWEDVVLVSLDAHRRGGGSGV